MDKVKQLMEAGLSTADAIKHALGMPIAQFAAKYQLPASTVSLQVNSTVRPTDRTITALVEELGGTENEWRELLWLAARPAHLAAS